MIDTKKYKGHTPGPWKIVKYEVGQYGEKLLSSIEAPSLGSKDPVCDSIRFAANARLIADAPALLAELKQARDRIKELEARVEGLEGITSM